MTAILTINATTPSTLWAVLRDPTVQLWIQLDYAGPPGARCVVNGRPVADLSPPATVAEAVLTVKQLLAGRGIVPAAVAHRLPGDRPRAELIDESFLATLGRIGPARNAITAALVMWPVVPQLACSGSEPDAEAMVDHQARALIEQRGGRLSSLAPRDDRAERMLADPRKYFAQAREQARLDVEREITSRTRRPHRRSR